MNLQCITFERFRSLGKNAKVEFDAGITFFVGKNHTGKSNVRKLLEELAANRPWQNTEYVLKRDNWFNSEAGVEKPLKVKFELVLKNKLQSFLSDQLFIFPLIQGLQEAGYSEILSLIDNNKAKIALQSLFGDANFIIQIEFIRYSDQKQRVNYSIQYNDFIYVNTADGRSFIQNIKTEDPTPKVKEQIFWESFLADLLNSTFIAENLSNDEFNESIKWFKSTLDSSSIKYVFISDIISTMLDILFKKFLFFHGNRIRNQRWENYSVEERLIANLSSLQHRIEEEVNNNEKIERPKKNHSNYQKYVNLVKTFENIYEGLDLTFAIIPSIANKPSIQFYHKTNNQIIYNFDSIGFGILENLNLLYYLIVEEGNFLILEDPELYLHPHSQRLYYSLIKENAGRNQINLITHSLYFFHPEDLFNLRIFTLKNRITEVLRLELPTESDEYYKLKRNFSIRNRDAIFADGLIFVEGPTEEVSFSYIFKSYGLDLDVNNISLINMMGKGNFVAFLKFAHQLKKKYWFFFDNDVLGVKAGEIIVPKIFKRSIIYKKRYLFPIEISRLCDQLVTYDEEDVLEFHGDLELLRSLLHKQHIFVFKTDFEGYFEEFLGEKIYFSGGKVDRAMQLIDYMKDHEEKDLIPEKLFEFIEIINEELDEIL